MAAAVPMLDDVIKEYLVFRGFTNTLKSFESDLKADKDKSFRVDKIVDQLYQYILSYDILGLRDYWGYLDERFFKRLDYQHNSNVKKLETCLLRLYIVHALQNSKNDKVVEFFEKYTAELQALSEWKEWFAIPFIKNPEQNATFEMYFQRAWQETFFLSLYNFLITLFYHMPMPTLLKYDEERGKLQRLEQEVLKLKEQVVSLAEEGANLQRQKFQLEQELEDKQRNRTGTVEEDDAGEFFVVSRPQLQPKFLSKTFSKIFKDKPEKNKKGKAQKQQQEEQTQAKLKRQQLFKQQQQIQQLQEQQQKQLSLLEEEQFKSSTVESAPVEKPQDQDTEVQIDSAAVMDEEDAETHKSPLHKSQSFDITDSSGAAAEGQEDGEKTGPAIRRSHTLPGRLKASALLQREKISEEHSRTVHFEGTDEPRSKPFIFLGQEEYKEHHSAIVHCRFSSSGRMIGSADADGIVKVWTNHPDIKTCTTIMSKSPLLSLEWAPKPDRLLLLGTGNCKVRFYDTENKKTICDVATESHYPRIVSLSCSPTGAAFVCSAAASKKSVTSPLRLSQSFSKYSEMSQILSPTNPTSCAGVLQCWDMKAMKVERQLPLDPLPTCINCTAFNHNGTLCVSGGADGMIRLFDMRSFDCLIGWQAHVGEVCSIQFSADETTVYSMGTDGKFSQWSVHRMGQKVEDLDIHDGAVWCEAEGPGSHNKSKNTAPPASYGRMFAFDAEGQYLLSCGPENGVLYRVEKNKVLSKVLSLPEHRSPVVSVDWSSSLSCYTCLTGSADGSVLVTSLLKH